MAVLDEEGEKRPDGVDEEEEDGGCAEREDHDAAAHVGEARREEVEVGECGGVGRRGGVVTAVQSTGGSSSSSTQGRLYCFSQSPGPRG